MVLVMQQLHETKLLFLSQTDLKLADVLFLVPAPIFKPILEI